MPKAIAEEFSVSRAWVQRVVQRRRETGEVEPRRQTRWRTPILAGREDDLRRLVQERPDRTLAKIRAALQISVGISTLWRACTIPGTRRLHLHETRSKCR
jgi:transposase